MATGAKSLIGSYGRLVLRLAATACVLVVATHRVAVRDGLGDRVGADIAACAGAVLDHDLLAEPVAQLLRDDARNDVRAAAGREGYDQADRSLRPSVVAGLGNGGDRDHRPCQCDR